MNHLRIVGVSIVVLFLGGSFSFNSVYGQIGASYCGRNTPFGELCASDPNVFTPASILIYLAVGIGVFLFFYFLLRKLRFNSKPES